MDVKFGYLQGTGGGHYGQAGPHFHNHGYDSMFSPMGGMGFSSPMMMMNMMQMMMGMMSMMGQMGGMPGMGGYPMPMPMQMSMPDSAVIASTSDMGAMTTYSADPAEHRKVRLNRT